MQCTKLNKTYSDVPEVFWLPPDKIRRCLRDGIPCPFAIRCRDRDLPQFLSVENISPMFLSAKGKIKEMVNNVT